MMVVVDREGGAGMNPNYISSLVRQSAVRLSTGWREKTSEEMKGLTPISIGKWYNACRGLL